MKEKILGLEKGAMERWRQGDPWGWAEISAEDVTYVDPGLAKPVVGISEYKAYLKQFENAVRYEGSEFIDPEVVVAGEAAVLTYNYRSTGTAPDWINSGQTLWNTTEVYFRLNGQWKIAHTHWSYVRHQPSDGVEVPVPVSLASHRNGGLLGELMALESGAMQRWRKGDPWGFIEISAPYVTYFDTGTPHRLNGLEALRAEYGRREGKVHFDVMEFIDPRVQAHGNLAVLTYRFFSICLNPDGTVRKKTPWNCTEVFQHNLGKWQIIHTHWSYIKGEKP